MHRLDSTREGKLRAACDRCHDLKNRCVRTGGGDSRCDRCERLGIDCVYSNLSRIGRPRNTQRRPSKQSMDAAALSLVPDDGPRSAVAAEEATADQIECSTARIESPSNVMSLLMDPEAHTVAHSHATMDWSLDFSPQTPGHGILSGFQDVHATVPGLLPPPSPCVIQGAVNSSSIAEQNTEKLLQLQGHLHRLLWTMEKDPSTDLVEDSLEVIKTFMEILQSVLADNDNSPVISAATMPPITILPKDQEISNAASSSSSSSTSESRTTTSRGSISSTETSTSATTRPMVTDYLTAQQALTCYSYMLLLLDRVVNQTTSSTGGTLSSPSSLRLGVFSLASQPALNAEVVLHMVLRMVLRLRGLIQGLVAGFGGSAAGVGAGAGPGGGAEDATSNGSASNPSLLSSRTMSATTLAESGSSRSRGLSVSSLASNSSSIAASLRVIADMVSERERILLERLT